MKGNNTLTGKWKLAGSMVSAGGPMYYVPAANKNSYIQFNADYTLVGNVFADYNYFKIKDSVTVTLTKADKTSFENYRYSFRNDTLVMSPSGPLFCIEGCSDLFVR